MYTVLVVDEHPAIRLAVRTIFQSTADFRVIAEAGDGAAALEMLRHVAVDLVVTDIDLPKLDGLSLIARIQAMHPHTRAVVLTARDPVHFTRPAQRAGARGYINKMQDLSALERAARTVLSGYCVFPGTVLHPMRAVQTDPVAKLSGREVAVLQHLARGLSNKEIAGILLISNKTVSTYKTRMLEKLNLSTLVELVDFARGHRLAA